MMLAWLVAFAVTQMVEMPIYLLAGKATKAEAFGASALTHPIVWFVVCPLVKVALEPLGFGTYDRWLVAFVVAETFAVVTEAMYLRRLAKARPLLLAFVANASSVAVGLTGQHLTGWA